MRAPIRLSPTNYFEINAGETAAFVAIAKFHPANGRAASTRRYTSVKVNRRVLLFAGLLCLRKLRIRATIIVTSVTYSPGLMAVTMAATPARAGLRRSLGWGPREVESRGCAKECVRGGMSTQRHHHRCYLNVFVGGQRDGGVIMRR